MTKNSDVGQAEINVIQCILGGLMDHLFGSAYTNMGIIPFNERAITICNDDL